MLSFTTAPLTLLDLSEKFSSSLSRLFFRFLWNRIHSWISFFLFCICPSVVFVDPFSSVCYRNLENSFTSVFSYSHLPSPLLSSYLVLQFNLYLSLLMKRNKQEYVLMILKGKSNSSEVYMQWRRMCTLMLYGTFCKRLLSAFVHVWFGSDISLSFCLIDLCICDSRVLRSPVKIVIAHLIFHVY